MSETNMALYDARTRIQQAREELNNARLYAEMWGGANTQKAQRMIEKAERDLAAAAAAMVAELEVVEKM